MKQSIEEIISIRVMSLLVILSRYNFLLKKYRVTWKHNNGGSTLSESRSYRLWALSMEGSKISEYKGVLLTTTNFVVWEWEIRDFLEENDLIDLVISSDCEKNRKKGLKGPGQVALTRLKASLLLDIKEMVWELNHDTLQKLWDFLKKEFGWLSLEECLLKLGEAAQVKLTGFDAIYSYLNHVDTIVWQVGGEDFLVPKWMHVMWYLMGLPVEYQPVVSEIWKLKEE